MRKKIFVTGSKGFIGSKLTIFLESMDYEVLGYSERLENHILLETALNSFDPDIVVHLAGLSNVPYCETHPDEAYISNLAGVSILLEKMGRLKRPPQLIFASSAQVYNLKSSGVSSKLVDENFELGPNNVYGRAKLQAEWVIQGSAPGLGIKAVILRLFNHSHKDQDPGFFLPSMYLQIRNSQNGSLVKVGNLALDRDFSLVSDLLLAIDAVVKNLEKMDQIEVFNVCSGQPRRLRNLIEALSTEMGKSIELQEDPERVRSGEPIAIVGDGEKLKRKTGFSQPLRSDAEYVRQFLN